VVTVGSAAGFAPGDKVMIIQMKGATVNTANNATFGQITAYNNAGNYEFGTIASIAGTQVTLSSALTQTYTTTAAVQLIRVPVYTNAVVTGTLTCQAWNGSTGGVLVFESTCDVTLNANIDVTGRGFRGGNIVSSFFNCNDGNYATSFAGNSAGQKGEGIAAYPPNLDANRAPLANGGGGSNWGNPGAGGGSNAGAGGRGGNEFTGCANTSWGIGGYALTLAPTRAFMGGGGGGGYRDNGLSAAAGSNGGGLVFINAPSIAGNNFSILANGANVTTVTDSEGAGGGGGGGAVHIWTNAVTSQLNINTRGGSGGNMNSTLWSSGAHGPGGGGGGGYVYFSSAATPANVTVTTTGGSAGLIQHPGAWFNTTFGAAAGANGAILYNLPLASVLPPASVSLMNDTTICPEDNILLDPGAGYTSYLWSDGSTSQTLTTSGPGTYWVEVPACGVLMRDTVVITNHNPSVTIGPDQTFCTGDSVQFDAGPGYTSYLWNSGETTSSAWVLSAGPVWVDVTDANGCAASDTANAITFTSPVVDLGNDTSLCPGFTVTFDAGTGYVTYQWQDGAANQTYTVSSPGQYSVTITDGNNCTDSDSVQVNYYPPAVADLGPDTSFCAGGTVTLNPGAFAGYSWWDGSGAPTAVVSAAGWYWVRVTNNNGCTDTDSLEVQSVYANPVPDLGPDTSFCSGESAQFTPGPGYASYLWQDGSTGSIFTAAAQGTYSVTVMDNNGCEGNDAVDVLNVYPLPLFTLGPDFGICRGEQVQLTPANAAILPVTYLWRDDSNNPYYNLSDTGTYWLTVTDLNGCEYSDTVHAFLACPPTLYIPNAFTPNQDSNNPVFMAYGTNIRNFQMDIFNRWGQFVARINGLSDSWDGLMGSVPAPEGVYVYKVWYRDFEGDEIKTLYGHISLVR